MDENELLPCTTCKELKPKDCFFRDANKARGYEYYCKDCRKKSLDKRRAANRQRRYDKRNENKYKARTIVNNMIATGRLTKESCFLCGEADTQGHHLDYSYPTKVIWLCQKHHTEAHHGPA